MSAEPPEGRRAQGEGPPLPGRPLVEGPPAAEDAMTAFLAAVEAGDPTRLVRDHVRTGALDDWFGDRERPRMIHVLAIGKAAPRMVWGLVEASVPFRGFGVAAPGLRMPAIDTFTWRRGDHPVPGDASLAAGEELLAWVDALPAGAPVLVLVSGGGSACVEAPAEGVARDVLTASWRRWSREGLPIGQLNARRARLSSLKAGGLGRRLLARTPRVRVWVLADTPPGDAPATVASGPCHVEPPEHIPHTVLADNDVLVEAAGAHLAALGWSVYRHARRMDGDAREETEVFLSALAGLEPPAALVGGGEPVVPVPEDAPAGGRCHHAALVATRWLARGDTAAVFLAGTSDGVDGGTGATGAWTDGSGWDTEAARALAGHAAHRWLAARGRSFDLGATGTNLNDVFVALRPASPGHGHRPPARRR